jgi:phosphoribosylglycinamide formyltransferase 1
MIKNIVIFASGEGSNTQKIIDYFRSSEKVNISLIVSNKASANVLNRAKNNTIPTLVLDRDLFYKGNTLIEELKSMQTDLIVLAGFLWMIPEQLIIAFPNKIINIHPSLLPKFGGKGMYGMHVHKAVIASNEKESGITIHIVNEQYDEGKIIAQHACSISENETVESLGEKIHKLEYEYFPKAIEFFLSEKQ